MKDIRGMDIEALAREAVSAGERIDVSEIGYGRQHWGDYKSHQTEPTTYYSFLSGLVNYCGVETILEIGTHCAGGTRALSEGSVDKPCKIVTVDITRESDPFLKGKDNITKIVGDGNDQETAHKVSQAFGEGQKIDLLFIDAAHDYFPTVLSYGLYQSLLNPSIILFDDINLNEDMRLAWQKVTAQAAEGTYLNISSVMPEVRQDDVGLGLLICPHNFEVDVKVPPIQMSSPIKARLRRLMLYYFSDKLGNR